MSSSSFLYFSSLMCKVNSSPPSIECVILFDYLLLNDSLQMVGLTFKTFQCFHCSLSQAVRVQRSECPAEPPYLSLCHQRRCSSHKRREMGHASEVNRAKRPLTLNDKHYLPFPRGHSEIGHMVVIVTVLFELIRTFTRLKFGLCFLIWRDKMCAWQFDQ